MMTGWPGLRDLTAAASSSPFMLGIAKSVITRSKFSFSSNPSAALPLLAVCTSCPSNTSIILTASQTNGSSSTTRIFFGGMMGAAINQGGYSNEVRLERQFFSTGVMERWRIGFSLRRGFNTPLLQRSMALFENEDE